ncbi:MAG TPA: hypothetical protein VIL26_06730 [Clostridia bacterium]
MAVVKLFSKDELLEAKKLLKIYITAIIVSFVILTAVNVLIVVFRHNLGVSLAKMLNIILTAVYLCVLWFFFSLKFRLTRQYYKTLKNIFTGLTETYTGKFLYFDDNITQKDGVQYYVMMLEEKMFKRPDMPQRRVLIRKDLEHPPFSPGDVIKYRSHAGILLEYEIISKAEVE